MIDLIQLCLKEEITAKPNKIVAGLEPENTNVFLQAVYRSAVSLENSAGFVKKVKAKHGEDVGADEEQEAPPKKKKPKKDPEPEEA
jgi:TRAF3-interacting protein 1